MSTSRWLCRLLVVCVLTVGLWALPAGMASASGDESETQSAQDSGLIQELLDWLVRLVDSDPTDDETGDGGGQYDPMG